jgi:hypothetical protein
VFGSVVAKATLVDIVVKAIPAMIIAIPIAIFSFIKLAAAVLYFINFSLVRMLPYEGSSNL